MRTVQLLAIGIGIAGCIKAPSPRLSPAADGVKVAVVAGPYKERGAFEPGCPGTGESYAEDVRAELGKRGVRIVMREDQADVLLRVSVGNDAQPHAQAIVDGEQVGAVTVYPCEAGELVDKVVADDLLGAAAQVVAHRPKTAPASSSVAQAAPAPPAPGAAPPRATAAAVAPPAAHADEAMIVAAPQPSAYAVIFGIERYRDVPAPDGARHDAEAFARLVQTTLGVPAAHIQVGLDDRATKNDIEKNLDWVRDNVQAGGRVYFFFSGHGAPEPTTGTSYLLPYDGDPRYLERTAVTLSSVVKALGETKARDVIAVVDACFSGAGGRSVLPPGARPLVRAQETPAPTTRIALLTSASGAEISGPTADRKGGLFTHYLVDAIGQGRADANGDGEVSLEETLDWVSPRVARDAKLDNRTQTPRLVVGADMKAADTMLAWGLPTK